MRNVPDSSKRSFAAHIDSIRDATTKSNRGFIVLEDTGAIKIDHYMQNLGSNRLIFLVGDPRGPSNLRGALASRRGVGQRIINQRHSMATMRTQMNPNTRIRTGFDIYWPEIKDAELKKLDASMPKMEKKEKLKKALKQAWAKLPPDMRDFYEQKAKQEANAVSSTRTSLETTATNESMTSSGKVHQFFELGKGVSKTTPAKENSPVDNCKSKLNLDATSISSASTNKRRKTIAEQQRERTLSSTVPRVFTSIRDTSSVTKGSSSSSSSSSSVGSSGGVSANPPSSATKASIKVGASGGSGKNAFFMSKEEKARMIKQRQEEEGRRAEQRKREEAERRMQMIRETRQKEKEQREKLGQTGGNAFFVQSKERIAKERAEKAAAEAEASLLEGEDEGFETAAVFPECQSVGAVDAGFVLQVPICAKLPNGRVQTCLEDGVGSGSGWSQGGGATLPPGSGWSQGGGATLPPLVADFSALSELVSSYVDDACAPAGEGTSARTHPSSSIVQREVVNLADDAEGEQEAVGCTGLWRDVSSIAMVTAKSTTDSLVDSFRPMSEGEVLGSDEAKHELGKWLRDWADARAESRKRKGHLKRMKTKRRRYDSDSDDDYDGDENALDNVAAVTGVCGCGKTAIVYALARQTGYNVIEIGANQSRSGAEINKVCEEASRSQGLQDSQQRLNLILFDDADLEFAEDAGMVLAMQKLIKTTRTPIIVTAESLDGHLSFLERIGAREIALERPSVQQVGQLASSILRRSLTSGDDDSDGLTKARAMGHALAQLYRGDTRKCLHALHLMLPSLRMEREPLGTGLPRAFGEWLLGRGTSQVRIDFVVQSLLASIESRIGDESSAAGMLPAPALALCCPVVCEVYPRDCPRNGGHLITLEGCNFLQRRPKHAHREGGSTDILPVVVLIGGKAVAPENVSVMSDEVVKVRAPEELGPGVHEIIVELQLSDSMSLRSNLCGTAGAWVRVRPPPSRDDIRTFFADQSYSKDLHARRKGLTGALAILQDSGKMIPARKSEYVDDSDEEQEEEALRSRRHMTPKGKKRSQGSLVLVKKARTAPAPSGDDGVNDDDDDEEIIEDESTTTLKSTGAVDENRRKRRIEDDDDDESKHGNEKATFPGHEHGLARAEAEGPLSEEQMDVVSRLDAEVLRRCMEKALDAIIEVPLCKPFLHPVDLNLCPDYQTHVSRPMDLGTVQDILHTQEPATLKSLRDFTADVRLVWSNCYTYNLDTSDISRAARVLSTAFEASLRAEFTSCLRPLVGTSEDVDSLAASLLPPVPRHQDVTEGDLVEAGLMGEDLPRTELGELLRKLDDADANREKLCLRAENYPSPAPGLEYSDPEAPPRGTFPRRLAESEEERGSLEAVELLSKVLGRWSDADVLETPVEKAFDSECHEQLLLWRRCSEHGQCLGSWDLGEVSSRHVRGLPTQAARGALLQSFKVCPTPKDTRLTDLPADDVPPQNWAQTGDCSAASVTRPLEGTSGGGDEVVLDSDEEDVDHMDIDEEEEFDEGRYVYSGDSRRSSSASGDSHNLDDFTTESTLLRGKKSDLLCAPSLQVPLRQSEYIDFVAKTLVPFYRISRKGPQRRVFDNLCLTRRVSRAMALDNIPLISKLLRNEEPSQGSLGRSSRRALAPSMQMQVKYPYFFSKAPDFLFDELLTLIDLGRIDL